jgi:hypothetical protein
MIIMEMIIVIILIIVRILIMSKSGFEDEGLVKLIVGVVN